MLKRKHKSKLITLHTNIGKIKLTYIPRLKLVALGHYRGKTGGCDSLNKHKILRALKYLWTKPKKYRHIYFEGQNLADTKTTYVEYMKELNDEWADELGLRRKCYSLSLYLDVEEAIARVEKRNGGVKMKNNAKKLRQKHKAVINQTKWLKQNAIRLGVHVEEYYNTGTKHDLLGKVLELCR